MTEITAPGALSPIALTGATGFVGRRVVALANRPVRALTRRPQPPQPGVEWVLGDLDDTNALARLCEGAAAMNGSAPSGSRRSGWMMAWPIRCAITAKEVGCNAAGYSPSAVWSRNTTKVAMSPPMITR